MISLATDGYDIVRVLDYEDGLTMAQILASYVEVGRISLIKEKKLVNGVVVALSSLFDSKLIGNFNASIDSALKQTDIFSERNGDEASKPLSKKSEEEANSAVKKVVIGSRSSAQRSVQELNKLNKLLS